MELQMQSVQNLLKDGKIHGIKYTLDTTGLAKKPVSSVQAHLH
jgi:hypothetical protein